MSNIINATPGQYDLTRLIETKLTKLGQSIAKAINKEVADMKLAIGLDKATGIIDADTAHTLYRSIDSFAVARQLTYTKAIEIESRRLRNRALARVPQLVRRGEPQHYPRWSKH